MAKLVKENVDAMSKFVEIYLCDPHPKITLTCI